MKIYFHKKEKWWWLISPETMENRSASGVEDYFAHNSDGQLGAGGWNDNLQLMQGKDTPVHSAAELLDWPLGVVVLTFGDCRNQDPWDQQEPLLLEAL